MFKQAEKPTVKRHKVDNITFVETWLKSTSVEEVANRLEIGVTTASSKAYSLRQRGVNLPKKAPRPQKSEVDKLNDIIKKYNRS